MQYRRKLRLLGLRSDEEELLRRHKGLDYSVQQLVGVLPGFWQYARMLRGSLPSDVPNNFRVFPFVGDRSTDDAPCRGARCLALGLAVEFCEDKQRGQWCKLFGTDDKSSSGRVFV